MHHATNRLGWIVALILLYLVAQPGALQGAPGALALRTSALGAGAPVAYAALPLAFEPNAGQAAPDIPFLARTAAGTLLVLPTGLTWAPAASAPPRPDSAPAGLQLTFAGTLPGATLHPTAALSGRVSYLLGDDPGRWHRNIPTYARLSDQPLYPGIDLAYDGPTGQLQATFTLTPGADATHIRWRYFTCPAADAACADQMQVGLDANGHLQLPGAAGGDPFSVLIPQAWQTIGGRRLPITAGYALQADGSIGLALAAYDHAQPLTIVLAPNSAGAARAAAPATSAPTLTFASYLGGSSADAGAGIAVDADGYIYLTGSTSWPDFPLANPYQAQYGGGTSDAFVTKLDPRGPTLIYSTFLGGGSTDGGRGIAVDGAGEAVVTGITASTNFPRAAARQPQYGGGAYDGFVTKLDPSGAGLIYSTYLGGSGYDQSWSVAVALDGSAYVGGDTNSLDFPIVNAAQPSIGGSFDAFVTKLNPAGSALLYSTYLGGGNDEGNYGLAVDSADSAYITGLTWSVNYPLHTPFQSQGDGYYGNAFVSKLTPAGNALAYSTYLGGTGSDVGTSIAVDAAGAAVVAGYTTSAGSFPLLNAIQPLYAGGAHDAFLTKLTAAGSALAFSTFLGGQGDDQASGVAVTPAGDIALSGTTPGQGFPLVHPFTAGCAGGRDAFLSRLSGSGSTLIYSSCLGGSADDSGAQVAVTGAATYLTGMTASSNFPLVAPVQSMLAGPSDAFVAEVGDVLLPPSPTPTGTPPTSTPTPAPRPSATPSPSPTLPTPGADPDLEPGFPQQAYQTAGMYHSGPTVFTLVGNIDADPRLEILVSAEATGPIYAWHWDGSPAAGWPSTLPGMNYPALGRLSRTLPGLQVFSGDSAAAPTGRLTAYAGFGAYLPGWPRWSANFADSPAALADVDGDGLDEIFTDEENGALHAYRADGSVLPGWPAPEPWVSQQRHTPAIADLDGDCHPEIVTAAENVNGYVYLFAHHADGSIVPGWPVAYLGMVDTYPVIGDVDGDGQAEIVVPGWLDQTHQGLRLLRPDGTVKRTIPMVDPVYYSTAPALADLDGDGVPEIVVQSNNMVMVWKGDGTPFPGWPQSPGAAGNSGAVVGDVDGDGQPDIVVEAASSVVAYDRYGHLLPRFPKPVAIYGGAVPAIADVDGDGRNEIVVSGDPWAGNARNYDKVWMFDLHGPGPYGPVLWGQFGGDAEHQGHYPVDVAPCTTPTTPSPSPTPAPPAPSPTSTATRLPVSPSPTAVPAGTITLPPTLSPSPTSAPPAPSPTSTATRPPVSPSPTAVPVGTITPLPSTPTTVPPTPPGATVTPCALHFADVQPADYFYTPVLYLACHGAISGYADETFRPYAVTTRAQMVKIVVLAFAFAIAPPPAPDYTFADVPRTFPFFAVIETAAAGQIASGYDCGGPGEPCDSAHRPYFRPYANVTRGQLAKIVVVAAGWALRNPPAPTFADVAPGSAFFEFVETAASQGIISGYTCGGLGEPCDSARRPYFRQYNPATRGQIAKIVYGALAGRAPGPRASR